MPGMARERDMRHMTCLARQGAAQRQDDACITRPRMTRDSGTEGRAHHEGHTDSGIMRSTCCMRTPAADTCKETSALQVHTSGFSPSNALSIVEAYDVVLDCSDNPTTRYLVR